MFSRINCPLVVAAIAAAGAFFAGTARADYISTDVSGPPAQMGTDPNVATVYDTGGNGVQLKQMYFRLRSSPAPMPSPGASFPISSFFDVFTEVSLDGGGTWTPSQSTTEQTLVISYDNLGGTTTDVFATQMLQMNLTMGSLMIRESPTLPSSGQTTVSAVGDGTYRISSFFDIFTEVSLDGGNTWTPSTGGAANPMVLTDTPEPASAALLGVGVIALLKRRRR